jgi:hypothetical protein
MNITLSADIGLIEKAREVARRRETSLNQLVREYFTHLTEPQDNANKQAADEFYRLATEQPGRSPEGWKFNREEANRRG